MKLREQRVVSQHCYLCKFLTILHLPVNRVCHLQTNMVHVVELHLALVLSVDLLVTDQSGSGDGGLRHTVTDEEDNILCTSLLGGFVDSPLGQSLLVVVVTQLELVLSGFVQGQISVCLGGNVDDGRGLSIPGKQVLHRSCGQRWTALDCTSCTYLVVGKVPLFKRRIFDLEE